MIKNIHFIKILYRSKISGWFDHIADKSLKGVGHISGIELSNKTAKAVESLFKTEWENEPASYVSLLIKNDRRSSTFKLLYTSQGNSVSLLQIGDHQYDRSIKDHIPKIF